jgi:uncharacterized protein (UPF0333 family)
MKGQVALEFSMMVALAFIFFGIIMLIALSVIAQTSDADAFRALEENAESIRQELLFAAVAEEGYQRTFLIPQKIGGHAYTLETGNTSFTLTLDDGKTYTRETPLLSGILSKGEVTVKKQEGVVVLQ